MKNLFAFLLFSCAAFAQTYVRYDYQVQTTQASGGNYLPVYAIPGASISFYSCSGTATSSCNTLLTTYNSATGSSCPTNAQIVLQGTATCVATADPQGNFGTWLLPSGQYGYAFVVTTGGFTYPPFQFTVGTGNSTPGTVTTVSVASANGFQGTVANPTTTPAISVNVDSTHVLPVNTGAASNYLGQDGGYHPASTVSIQHNGTPAVSQTVLNFNDTTPAAPAGNQNVTFQNDSGGDLSGNVPLVSNSLQTQFVPPIAGQYVVLSQLPATACTAGTTCQAQQGGIYCGPHSSLNTCTGSWVETGFSLPSYVSPSNVTAIYAVAGAATVGGITNSLSCTWTGGGAGIYSNPGNGVYTVSLGTVPASVISSFSCSATISSSVFTAPYIQSTAGASLSLIVYYTGAAPPTNNSIQVAYPLTYQGAGILSINPNQPFPAAYASPYTVATLPPSSTFPYSIGAQGSVYPVRDGVGPYDCGTGGGHIYVLCEVTNIGTYAAAQSGTKFTTSGCSVSSTTGQPSAGKFTLGANNCSVVITMNGATGSTAPNGWSCFANDQTSTSVFAIQQTADSTTTATFSIPSGAGTTDVINFGCTPY